MSDDAAISGAASAALSFAPAATNHSGGYSVIVSNFVGSITSRVVSLNVAPLPKLTFTASTNGFVLAADNGATNNLYVVQTATNLAPPVIWTSVQTNMIDVTGQIRFVDTNRGPAQFYRLLLP